MKEIKLTQGKVALVDDEDFEKLNRFKWYARKGRNTFYAERNIGGRKQHRVIRRHRQILNVNNSQDVDHRDSDGLNNQRFNLRNCTNQQNCMNARPQSGCLSKFKGVYFHKQINRWRAVLTFNGKVNSCGCYATEEEAACAYNKKAVELFGSFARPNIIN